MATNTSAIQDKRAKAHPTKAFFVRMLTRDITLEACILDLIDNAIDAAWRIANAAPTTLKVGAALEQFRISLSIDPDRSTFTISDDCGGISLDDAAEYAFTFGREEDQVSEDFAVGVYGIGMKRAIFKLGRTILIRSTHEGDPPFAVPINVDDWMNDDSRSWDFGIDDDERLDAPGVRIEVTDLTEETLAAFSDPAFVNRIRRTIAQDYLLPLMQGLTIDVNGEEVTAWNLVFRTGGDFQPMRVRYDDDDVAVEIIAGMVALPSDDSQPQQDDTDRRSGWYVLCNGRVVLTADRTSTTVWARPQFPQWHPQYEGFVGVVLFSSQRPELLPMTTTKNGVDTSSPLYRRAIPRMQEPTRAWINYTNARKTALEVARRREAKTQEVSIVDVSERPAVKLPSAKRTQTQPEANVLYAVPLDRMKKLARRFGRASMPYKQVGLRSFNYAYEHLVEDDD